MLALLPTFLLSRIQTENSFVSEKLVKERSITELCSEVFRSRENGDGGHSEGKLRFKRLI